MNAVLISDFTVGGLVPFLRTGDTPLLRSTLAPYDQVVPTLLDASAECWRPAADIAVVWTRPHVAIKSFARVMEHERVGVSEILLEVDRFAEYLHAASSRVSVMFVPTWTWPSSDRGLGVLNLDPQVGPAYFLNRMNARLVEAVAGNSTIRVLDANRWVALAGPTATSSKLWHLGKIAFGPEVFKHAASDMKAALRASRGESRKLIVLDLDDTLWGGVVGDIGWQNLNIGGHNPAGEAYAALQRALKRLTARGIVLAIVSKNTEAVALEAIDRHPEMVLRRNDFAGWAINWNDKAQNLVELTRELNLGLESVVFIDDNPAERARVREALPQVLVPEWPTDKLMCEQALTELTCFDTLTLTEEDQFRTRSYTAERDRKTAGQLAKSLDDYLSSLDLQVTVEHLDSSNVVRAVQLLNKTNQMNLATRRLSQAEYARWAACESHYAFVFRTSDRFGDHGLTGVASLSVSGAQGQIDDFVLSCRVMGRGVEQAMLHALIVHAKSIGLDRLIASYIATPRNSPCKLFFDEDSSFSPSRSGNEYVWEIANSYAAPQHVTVHFPDAVQSSGI